MKYARVDKYFVTENNIGGSIQYGYPTGLPDVVPRDVQGKLNALKHSYQLLFDVSKKDRFNDFLNQLNHQIEIYIKKARTIKDEKQRLTDEQILNEINNVLQTNKSFSLEYYIEHVPSYKKFVDEHTPQDENLNQ